MRGSAWRALGAALLVAAGACRSERPPAEAPPPAPTVSPDTAPARAEIADARPAPAVPVSADGGRAAAGSPRPARPGLAVTPDPTPTGRPGAAVKPRPGPGRTSPGESAPLAAAADAGASATGAASGAGGKPIELLAETALPKARPRAAREGADGGTTPGEGSAAGEGNAVGGGATDRPRRIERPVPDDSDSEGAGAGPGPGGPGEGETTRVRRFLESGGASLDGRLVDVDTGRAIAGAEVEGWMGTRSVEGESDADGRFRFEGLVPGSRLMLWMTAPPQFVQERIEVTIPSDRSSFQSTFKLLSRAAVSGALDGGAGLFLTRRGSRTVVTGLVAFGPAERAGVRVGDTIVGVAQRKVGEARPGRHRLSVAGADRQRGRALRPDRIPAASPARLAEVSPMTRSLPCPFLLLLAATLAPACSATRKPAVGERDQRELDTRNQVHTEPAPRPPDARAATGAIPPPSPPSPAGPSACASSAQCEAGQICSTERGDCNRPPGCGPNDICPAVCWGHCVPRTNAAPRAEGVRCGNKICPAGQVCCNASCSVCTPPDGFCLQQVCP